MEAVVQGSSRRERPPGGALFGGGESSSQNKARTPPTRAPAPIRDRREPRRLRVPTAVQARRLGSDDSVADAARKWVERVTRHGAGPARRAEGPVRRDRRALRRRRLLDRQGVGQRQHPGRDRRADPARGEVVPQIVLANILAAPTSRAPVLASRSRSSLCFQSTSDQRRSRLSSEPDRQHSARITTRVPIQGVLDPRSSSVCERSISRSRSSPSFASESTGGGKVGERLARTRIDRRRDGRAAACAVARATDRFAFENLLWNLLDAAESMQYTLTSFEARSSCRSSSTSSGRSS